MMSLIIVLGVVLVLYILYLLFRVGNLVSIAKGKKEERYDSSNSIHATLFVIFMIASLGGFFWYSYAFFDDYTLPLASEHGVKIDSVFWITMAVTVISFSIISIVMFIFPLPVSV